MSPLITKAIVLNFNNYNFILQQFNHSMIIPSNNTNEYSEEEEINLFSSWITKHIDFNLLKIFVKKTNYNEFIVVNSHFIKFIDTIINLNEKKLKKKFNARYSQIDLNYIIKNIKIINIDESNYRTDLKIQYLYYLLNINSLRTIIFNKNEINYSVVRIDTMKILKLLLCYIPIHNLTNMITYQILSKIQ